MTNSPNSANKQITLDYCINKAIPEGSSLYYATLFNKKNKEQIICLHALLNELGDIINECSDPGVARIKFKWWQEEILRMKESQSRHPVTQQLQKHFIVDKQIIDVLNRVIENFEQFIFFEQPDTLNSILSLFKSSYGEIWKLNIQKKDADDLNLLNAFQEMGAIYHYLNCLQQPYIYITESRCIIPASYIKHTSLLDLKFDKSTPSLEEQNAIKQLFIDLTTNLYEIHNSLDKQYVSPLMHGLILNRIAIKTADEIRKEGVKFLKTGTSLTPIRKLWIAWYTNISTR